MLLTASFQVAGLWRNNLSWPAESCVRCAVQEYYQSILKKLKEVGASSRQSDFYV